MDAQSRPDRQYSFEFSPPRTEESAEKLRGTIAALAPLNPAYFSVTFGAGGSTQVGTVETVMGIRAQGQQACPHISCIGTTRPYIRDMLTQYRDGGIARIVALRGDLPSGMHDRGDFRYANELVAFIRAEFGRHFHIEVAAYPEMHPQAPSAQADMLNFKRKIDAGADSAITQYFFNPDAYARFVDEGAALGVRVPIVPGIMPITNSTQLVRFSDACGAEIPRWIRKRLEGFGDDRASIRAFGLDVVTQLCQRLLGMGAPGLHFYTLNMAEPTLALWKNLGL